MSKKRNTQVEASDVVIEVEEIKVDDFLQRQIDSIILKEGECVMVEVDINLNEYNPTAITIKQFNATYANLKHKGTDINKFKLKKK